MLPRAWMAFLLAGWGPTATLPDADASALKPLAQAVLNARVAHVGATLADLYDPDLMRPTRRPARTRARRPAGRR